MKLNMLSMIATLTLTASALACPGGHLLQVIVKEKGIGETVVAAYNKRNGESVAANRSYHVTAAKAYMKDEETNRIISVNACADKLCNKLIEMSNATVEFSVTKTDRNVGTTAKFVVKKKNVYVGPSAPMPKGPVLDIVIDPLKPIACAR